MRFSTLRIAWRNLGRNRKRTGLALAAVAIGQFALLAMAGLMNGYKVEIVKTITGPLIGDIQIHLPEWREERAMDLAIPELASKLAEIRSFPEVDKAFARIYAPALAAPEEDAHMVVVVGVDPESESLEGGLLEAAVEQGGARVGEGRILVGSAAAEVLDVGEGDEIAVIGQGADGSIANDLYTVAALIASPVDMIDRQGLVMSLEDAQRLFVLEDQAHEIIVHASSRDEVDALTEHLRTSPAFEGTEALPWWEIAPQAKQMIEMIDYSVLFVLVFVFIAAVAGVANTMMMSTFERVHEFGMLLALGSRPGRIVRMIFAEAVALGLAGAAIGTALGFVAVGITSHTGLDMAAMGGEAAGDVSFQGMKIPLLVYPWLKPSDVFIGVAALVVTSILAGVWPARIAARLEPVEALRG